MGLEERLRELIAKLREANPLTEGDELDQAEAGGVDFACSRIETLLDQIKREKDGKN